ncbi:MAG: metal ABC transporter permease [Clostridiales bacterium]|nr:metal ABC transporter permease [Clostridiales bacterium]
MQYAFMRRALLGGSVIALCAALLGVILVLKRFSMIGDGLSHVGFGALTVAYALAAVTAESLPAVLPEGLRSGIARLCAAIAAAPLPFTMVIVVLCAVLLLSHGSGVRGGDSSIAILSTGALAVGVIVSSTVKGLNIDVTNAMFGSILAMGEADVSLSVALSLFVLLVFILFYPRIFAVTFDEAFAQATGINTRAYNLMISVLTAVNVVVGMRIMGTMLISSLIILPAVTAMHVFSRFRAVVIASAVLSLTCFVLGLMLSCLCSLPTGAGIVVVDLCADALFMLIAGAKG